MRIVPLPLLIPASLLSALGAFAFFSSPSQIPSEKPTVVIRERRSFCFAPDTSAEVMAKYGEPLDTSDISPLSLLNPNVTRALQVSDRWSRTATNGTSQSTQGDPVTLTWSIVPDDTFITSGGVDGEVSSGSDLRARLAEIYGGTATGAAADQPWFFVFETAFDSLSSQTGLTFIYEPNDDGAALSNSARGVLGTRGDMRISGHTLDGNSNTLAYNYFPDYGDMVIDTADSFYEDTSNSSLGLRNVIEHEFGHGLGLDHVCPINRTKLMEPTISLTFAGSQFDTIYSLQRNYGDPFEKLNAALDNDSFANATAIPVEENVTYTSEFLGIDDNTDSDFLSFQAPVGSIITATITPSSNSYLEGSQLTNGSCSAGTTFDSSIQQDLTLALADPSFQTITSANDTGLGEAETVNAVASSSGTHYLRITGSGTNSNQLYTVEVLVDQPDISLEIESTTVTAELFSDQNGSPDPLETIELTVVLANGGLIDAVNAQATLDGSEALIPLNSSASLGDIPSEGSSSFTLTFALDGECGDTIALALLVTTDNSDPVSLPLSFTLGADSVPISEDFDSSANLPADWSDNSPATGSGWSVNSNANSAPNALFAQNFDSIGESILTSPTVVATSTESTLTFLHSYNTEEGFDGGILEISIDGGDWEDVLTAGGSFTTGEYDEDLSTGFDNPLAGSPAWTGNSNGFISTVLTFPASAIGENTQFRWRLGHDSSVSGVGWYLDDVSFDLHDAECDTSGPVFTLSSEDLVASEFSPEDSAELVIETPLPVSIETAVTLTPDGTADATADLTGLDSIAIPALSSSSLVTLTATSDTLVEGPEELTLTTADGLQSLTFTIIDTPYGTWAAANLIDSPLRESLDDPDGDHSPNIEEYLFGTNPALSTSRPSFASSYLDGTLRLSAPLGSLPEDFLLGAESSPNLQTWNPTFITNEDDEFILTPPSSPYFLRLTYDLLQTAP